jgi:hypothetical protein
VDPDVLRPNVDSIQTTVGTASDSHVVDLTIRAGVDGEMEGRRVHQRNVVNGKVAHVVQPEQSGATERTSLVEFEAMALNRALGRSGEELEIGSVLDENHVACSCASPGDGAIELQSPCFTTLQKHPFLQAAYALLMAAEMSLPALPPYLVMSQVLAALLAAIDVNGPTLPLRSAD